MGEHVGLIGFYLLKNQELQEQQTNCQVQQKPVRFHAIVIFNITTINISLHSEIIKCIVAAQIHTQTPSHLAANGRILSKKKIYISHASIRINSATHPWNQEMLGRIFGTLKIWMWKQVIAGRLWDSATAVVNIACQFIAKMLVFGHLRIVENACHSVFPRENNYIMQ